MSLMVGLRAFGRIRIAVVLGLLNDTVCKLLSHFPND